MADEKTAKGAAAQPAADQTPALPMPKEVRLLRPFGFIDSARRERSWKAGEVVADPTEISMLVIRKAMIEVLKA